MLCGYRSLAPPVTFLDGNFSSFHYFPLPDSVSVERRSQRLIPHNVPVVPQHLLVEFLLTLKDVAVEGDDQVVQLDHHFQLVDVVLRWEVSIILIPAEFTRIEEGRHSKRVGVVRMMILSLIMIRLIWE